MRLCSSRGSGLYLRNNRSTNQAGGVSGGLAASFSSDLDLGGGSEASKRAEVRKTKSLLPLTTHATTGARCQGRLRFGLNGGSALPLTTHATKGARCQGRLRFGLNGGSALSLTTHATTGARCQGRLRFGLNRWSARAEHPPSEPLGLLEAGWTASRDFRKRLNLEVCNVCTLCPAGQSMFAAPGKALTE
ncbi:hypothetical protein RRG08_050113 [Elysia crispata]|uniref:Uncharacterized protein n=1 Tax=Elysia crispata TaxID=231223 RepID=A0AAE1DAJ9_9GAST|nr:hypothetical protein RRG08_050113 [Elysia crispata]